MTDLYQCPDCGREYRADKLSSCPGCKHDNAMALNATPFTSGTRGSNPPQSDYLPPYERKPKYRDSKSFFAVLFNYKFEDFVFVRVARAFYLWILVISALALMYWEIALVSNFFNGLNDANSYDGGSYYLEHSFWPFVGSLVGLPILYLFEVIILRLILEAGVALIKIAENTAKKD